MLVTLLMIAVGSADAQRLQGDWLMVERYYPNGSVQVYPNGEQSINHFNIYVRGSTATIHHDWTDPDDEIEHTFSVVGPGRLDFVVSRTTGPFKKGERFAAIYKFEKDMLIVCDRGYGEPRPTEFKATEDAYLYKFMRAKAAEPEKPPYQIPAPKGWGKETIELPPKFAPDVSWKGVEELRFAPDWMKADSDTFFSYALLFWLPDDQKTDPKTMEKELLAYYRGLAKVVLESKKQKADGAGFTLTIKDAKEKAGKRAGGETYSAFVGELKWTEPFTTGKPQALRLEIHTWHNAKHKRNCVFICASPQPEAAAVWKQLREIRDGSTFP